MRPNPNSDCRQEKIVLEGERKNRDLRLEARRRARELRTRGEKREGAGPVTGDGGEKETLQKIAHRLHGPGLNPKPHLWDDM